mgnify:FL=1
MITELFNVWKNAPITIKDGSYYYKDVNFANYPIDIRVGIKKETDRYMKTEEWQEEIKEFTKNSRKVLNSIEGRVRI